MALCTRCGVVFSPGPERCNCPPRNTIQTIRTNTSDPFREDTSSIRVLAVPGVNGPAATPRGWTLLAPGSCARCGRHPAIGYAGVTRPDGGQDWYCHPDDDSLPDCYALREPLPPVGDEFDVFLSPQTRAELRRRTAPEDAASSTSTED